MISRILEENLRIFLRKKECKIIIVSNVKSLQFFLRPVTL